MKGSDKAVLRKGAIISRDSRKNYLLQGHILPVWRSSSGLYGFVCFMAAKNVQYSPTSLNLA